jgi:hypothetical protein
MSMFFHLFSLGLGKGFQVIIPAAGSPADQQRARELRASYQAMHEV